MNPIDKILEWAKREIDEKEDYQNHVSTIIGVLYQSYQLSLDEETLEPSPEKCCEANVVVPYEALCQYHKLDSMEDAILVRVIETCHPWGVRADYV